jgi:hypothetical protein
LEEAYPNFQFQVTSLQFPVFAHLTEFPLDKNTDGFYEKKELFRRERLLQECRKEPVARKITGGVVKRDLCEFP